MEVRDARFPLRPEIVESAYVQYRKTHDPRHFEMGRRIFEDLVAALQGRGGYTTTLASLKEWSDFWSCPLLKDNISYRT